MKKEICSFSGLPIHPGHGKRYVPSMVVSTKPVLPFVTAKARSLFLKKRNPRKVCWTIAYRRMMKKVCFSPPLPPRTLHHTIVIFYFFL